MQTKDYISLAMAFIALGTLIKVIIEYTKAQQWKQAEFITKEVKEFYADINVQRALQILDWDSGKISVFPGELNEGAKEFFYNEKLILSALRTHNPEGDFFTKEEFIIRKIFDTLFDKLSLFQHHIDAGLFRPRKLQGYLDYWLNIMFSEKNKRKTSDFKARLRAYIEVYEFNDLKKMLTVFGYS